MTSFSLFMCGFAWATLFWVVITSIESEYSHREWCKMVDRLTSINELLLSENEKLRGRMKKGGEA